MGAIGDAGAVVSNEPILLEKIRKFANHGSVNKQTFEMDGVNSRLDGIQAAILSIKLKYVAKWNEMRRQKAALYRQELANVSEIRLPKIREHCTHVFHAFAIQANQRDDLFEFLKNKGIECSVHYRKPLPCLDLYSDSGPRTTTSDFPVARDFCRELIALPFFPEIEDQEIHVVTAAIKSFYRR
jgi:dTDP-4-amino-4,6-dideoxygalactose transaminase